MESTNRTSFTITQPFLGAPLHFTPALGSKELEDMVDMYVIGNGPKNEKLSVVTVEFFNLATVDLNTGALTRTYEIFPFIDFEQSPMASQSPGFSPPIFTPSPASSVTFADSGYGSFSIPSMTPPTRTLGSARVTKKVAKKDAKKAKVEEARLPGFSIMTKDGVDVTTTAGRGTKTKEQREHAHLMRIMKACDACKKKKIRCDPSHRRSNDASRSSTTTHSSTGSAHISPQSESSPGYTVPAMSRHSTQVSQSPAAFTPTNPMEDFVLFPEDASWNPEMSQGDLGNFNFDINELDFNAEFSAPLEFPFYQQPFNNGALTFDQQFSQPYHQEQQQQQPFYQIGSQENYADFSISDSYDTPGGSFDMNQDLSESHTRPHPSRQSQDSDQKESSLQSLSDPSRKTRDSDQIESSRRNLSVYSMSQHANETLLSSTSDWSVLESSLLGDLSRAQSSTGPASLQRERVSSSRSPLSSDCSRNTNASAKFNVGVDSGTVSSRISRGGIAASAALAANSATAPGLQHSITMNVGNMSAGQALLSDSGPMISVDPSDPLVVPLQTQRSSTVSRSTVIHELKKSCLQVSESLQTIKSTRSEYTGLNTDLQRLRSVLQILQTRQETIVSEGVFQEVSAFHSHLSDLSSRLGPSSDTRTLMLNPLLMTLDPEYQPEFFRQCQISARRLVRSLCATINTVQAHTTGTHLGVTQRSTMGRSIREVSPFSSLPGTSMRACGSQYNLADASLFSYSNAILKVCQTQLSIVLASVVLAVLALIIFGVAFDCVKGVTLIMQSVQYITALKESCSLWISNSIARLVFCAIMATQLPIPTKSETFSRGLTPLFLLPNFFSRISTRMSSTSDDLVNSRACSGNNDGILARLTDFCPVVTVL
ncbi:hypothetical protein WAI453_011980 [Rhynchosporium graminicola]|uniref:Uncharacterized protein n=1 Tax=Rhynchosporium graminicola TaxID=2792576 RepID=A0A1E1KJI6_9HELO|nr:uncharacterized protein RCO7_08910 [Rhynchosporium commune]